jgi:hypothetical protein
LGVFLFFFNTQKEKSQFQFCIWFWKSDPVQVWFWITWIKTNG